MRTCGIVETFCRILPFKIWRGNVLERHLARCPVCRSRLAPREEAALYVVSPEGAAYPEAIWPAVEARIMPRPGTPVCGSRVHSLSRLWKPITAISTLAGAILLIVVMTQPPRREMGPRPLPVIEDFRLDSVEAWGRPAQALVYQAGEPRITIIWVR